LNITIPSTVTSIGENPFASCSGLKSITVESGNPNYDSREGCNAIIEKATNKLVSGCMNSFIPRTVTALGESAFEGCLGLTAINIPTTVTEMEPWAFSYCSGLKSVVIPNSIKVIDDYVFNQCSGLTSVKIPNTVTHIGESAFEKCYIDEVIISDNVQRLSDYCFGDCFIDDIHLPARLKHIGYAALNNNTLRNLELPNSLETIEGRAFHGLSKKSLVIPESVRRIDPFAFEFILVDTLDIRPRLDSIPRAAFYSSQSLVKLILPPTIKRIGRSAFYECYRLKECQLPEGLEEIEAWALAGADNMKEWHIPASVRKIDWAAFSVPNFSSHTVYVYAEEPPADTHLEAFADWTMEKSVLYVPEGSLDVYQQTAPWSYFGTILEFQPASIGTPQWFKEGSVIRSYDLQGRPAANESHGIHIVKTAKGARKVIQ
jgi:hypothetical protein